MEILAAAKLAARGIVKMIDSVAWAQPFVAKY